MERHTSLPRLSSTLAWRHMGHLLSNSHNASVVTIPVCSAVVVGDVLSVWDAATANVCSKSKEAAFLFLWFVFDLRVSHRGESCLQSDYLCSVHKMCHPAIRAISTAASPY